MDSGTCYIVLKRLNISKNKLAYISKFCEECSIDVYQHSMIQCLHLHVKIYNVELLAVKASQVCLKIDFYCGQDDERKFKKFMS